MVTPVDDAGAKANGLARYTADLVMEGMAHACLLRSPHPHAVIRRIDCSKAERQPGVFAVVTGADLAGLDGVYGEVIRDQPLIATDRVRYVGDVVAAVAAVDEATAFAALQTIQVDYELLPAVSTIEAALAPDAISIFDTPVSPNAGVYDAACGGVREPGRNVLFEFDYRKDDVERAFSACAHVFTDDFQFSRITHYHLEPLVTVARATDTVIELWSNNQDPFEVRENVARIFKMPEDNVIVRTGLVGGGFGGKSHCKTEPLAALIARKVRRPVRLCISMEEAMLSLSQHAAIMRLTTGVSSDGRLLARRCEAWLDSGAYADASAFVATQMGYCFPGPYRWEALHMNVAAVRTTTTPAGSFRGFGRVQSTWASESQIDMIARRLNLDPYAFRRRNLLGVGAEYLPDDTPIDCDLISGLDAVATAVGYDTSARPDRGKGLAVGFKSAGGHSRLAEARIRREPDGSVVVHTAACDMGQGTRDVMKRVASETLGIPAERVRIAESSTADTPFDAGSHACTGVALSATAVQKAAQMLKIQLDQLPNAPQLEGFAAQQQKQADIRFGSGNLYWQPAWAAAEVDIDIETGKLKVTQLVVAADAGHAINLQACQGQLLGGAIQGLGQALFEQLWFEEGQPCNAQPRRYRLPTALDLPRVFSALVLESKGGPGPFGAKGVGEATIMPIAAAIANAIDDAVGVRLKALPMSAESLFDALSAQHADTQRRPHRDESVIA